MELVNIQIDGKTVQAPEGATVLQAAKAAGIEIPTLCDDDRLEPYGACRMCMVEIEARGRKKYVASCLYPVQEGLRVQTQNDKLTRMRRMILELIWPAGQQMAAKMGVTESRFHSQTTDCNLCGMCMRYCSEVKKANVVYFKGRGIDRRPAILDPSSLACTSCGECFSLCRGGWIVSSRT
jgi:NADH dehydrogenase/NADH:ubiquinone oxidoreductase subunit G